MSDILDGFSWLTTAENWWGTDGILSALRQHVWYSLLATLAAVAIGFPIGLVVGHTGRGRFVASSMSGVWRAIPTIGVVTLLFRWQPLSVWPVLAGLVVLAVPPVMLNVIAGIDSVSPDIRDAADGMGLTAWQKLWQVEVPNGLPLMLAGVRSAANQVIATATVAGYVGVGTLGEDIFRGWGSSRYDRVYGATFLVILIVLAVELVFALLQRTLVSPGVRAGSRSRRRTADPESTAPEPAEPVLGAAPPG